jgi:hypothetical protein
MTTITQEQFEAIRQGVWDANGCRELAAQAFIKEGITITPAPPSAEMVKLAREIGAETAKDWPAVESMCSKAALAALQHAVCVVEREVKYSNGALVDRSAILTALGAGGRDAG